MDSVAEAILRTIRTHLGLRIVTSQRPDLESGDLVWRIEARNEQGLWTVEHTDCCKAATMLAELLGFDLEE